MKLAEIISTPSDQRTEGFDAERVLADARAVIEAEGAAVYGLVQRLSPNFAEVAARVLACTGSVIVAGLGKSGIVGQKISATFASTGTPSHFVHAAEAAHGDLGRLTKHDIVIAISNSGESEELLRLVKPVKALGPLLVAMTGNASSSLAKHAEYILDIGDVAEACPMGLVPTASTTAMMVLGDALAMAIFNCRGFGREEYARFHPGGHLGRKLMKVSEIMRSGAENPLARDSDSLRDVIKIMTRTAGRPGAASIVNAEGALIGFFTDGDLRRLLENHDFRGESSIADIMVRAPKSVAADQLVVVAARVMREFKIDQLPVVDAENVPVGFIDIQDVLSTRVV
ncbi:MAG: KpsF/GutQ family sugar-phosphate isomerase [Clostridia bacterium]|nr:KpsF/GutQ family sugar-phosphate isomerase [Deltaproteobacteria bacterium]